MKIRSFIALKDKPYIIDIRDSEFTRIKFVESLIENLLTTFDGFFW